MIDVLLLIAIILGSIFVFVLLIEFLAGLTLAVTILGKSFKQYRRQAKVRRQRQRK